MTAEPNWDIEIYHPPQEGWPFVVVIRINGKVRDAEFEPTLQAAEHRKEQIHQRFRRVLQRKY